MTYDQHIASNPEISVWVSASAGTGKTKVLTDRVLRLLLTGCRPDKILCITYTKAAAAEMKHRIGAQLGAWAIISDQELREKLAGLTGSDPDADTARRARQLFALVMDAPEFRIQTIHSFCQSLLKRFPLEANIAPHFTLIDGHTSSELLQEAKKRLFSEAGNSECSKAIEALAGSISEAAFDELIACIVRDRSKFTSWLNAEAGAASLQKKILEKAGFTYGTTEKEIFGRHFAYGAEETNLLRQACAALAKSNGKSDITMLNALQVWLEASPDLGRCKSYSKAFLTEKSEPRKTLCTQAAKKLLPNLEDILRREQERVTAFAARQRSFHTIQATGHMIVLAEMLLGIYHSLKDAHGYMDYDDIIFYAVSLLHKKGAAAWVLYKLDGGIDHLLIDEAQDTGPEHWKLVEALTSEFFAGEGVNKARRSLFVVGDSKQSIFSFQGADPLGFDRMQSQLRKRITSAGMEFRNVNLALSFRSTEPVLQAVDEVFLQPAARDGLIFSESDISHAAHRKGMAGRVELWPLMEAGETEDAPAWHVYDKPFLSVKPETLLANEIALTIKGWLDNKRKILSQNRPLSAGDILILVQRRGTFTNAMLRALKQHNINVAGSDRLILTSHIAVEDCIALAHFLLLPQDDMTLATVLKSPFIGLSEEELFELAYDRREHALWQRLKDFAFTPGGRRDVAKPYQEGVIYHSAYTFLSDLLAKVDYLPPYELFAHILETLEGRKKLAARLGTEIYDPLNEFLSHALQYSNMHAPSLQGFLHWLQSGESEIKRDMEKAKDEVRIMTVHGAKGLQAPIVFLPDTTRLPQPEAGILWSDTDHVPLWSPHADYEDEHYRGLKERIKLQKEREYRRLLYVAMTRAEDELYICGWKGKKQVAEKCWYELIRQGISGNWKEENGKMALRSEQTEPPKSAIADIKRKSSATLPAWINTPPASEPAASRPLAPSRMEAPAKALSPLQDQATRTKGLLIHRLLQYIPDIAPEMRAATIEDFIGRYSRDFNKSTRERISREVMDIIEHPDFVPIFSPDSVAEAPISGIVHDKEGNPIVISGQIDRLAVIGDKVYVIDYKSNAQPPEREQEVPPAYLKQMEAYKKLVARIYLEKTIYCGLLWTTIPKLMFLTDLS